MHEAGRNLRKLREQLRLKYRDVEEFSIKIAAKYENQEFAIRLSRLADIENKGTVPSIYRLYSLSAIYGVDLTEVLAWYGISVADLPTDSHAMDHPSTHPVSFQTVGDEQVQIP